MSRGSVSGLPASRAHDRNNTLPTRHHLLTKFVNVKWVSIMLDLSQNSITIHSA
jgi:hypothetical protein